MLSHTNQWAVYHIFRSPVYTVWTPLHQSVSFVISPCSLRPTASSKMALIGYRTDIKSGLRPLSLPPKFKNRAAHQVYQTLDNRHAQPETRHFGGSRVAFPRKRFEQVRQKILAYADARILRCGLDARRPFLPQGNSRVVTVTRPPGGVYFCSAAISLSSFPPKSAPTPV